MFAVSASTVLRLSPLFVYFVYLFGHRQLPDSLDQPQCWIASSVAVGIAVVFVAI